MDEPEIQKPKDPVAASKICTDVSLRAEQDNTGDSNSEMDFEASGPGAHVKISSGYRQWIGPQLYISVWLFSIGIFIVLLAFAASLLLDKR